MISSFSLGIKASISNSGGVALLISGYICKNTFYIYLAYLNLNNWISCIFSPFHLMEHELFHEFFEINFTNICCKYLHRRRKVNQCV
jgi:hypothetical protein